MHQMFESLTDYKGGKNIFEEYLRCGWGGETD